MTQWCIRWGRLTVLCCVWINQAMALEKADWLSSSEWATPQLYQSQLLFDAWVPSPRIEPKLPSMVICRIKAKGRYDLFDRPDLKVKINLGENQLSAVSQHSAVLYLNFPGIWLAADKRFTVKVYDRHFAKAELLDTLKTVFSGAYPLKLRTKKLSVVCVDYQQADLTIWYARKAKDFAFQLELVSQSLFPSQMSKNWGRAQSGIVELTAFMVEMAALIGWQHPEMHIWLQRMQDIRARWDGLASTSVAQLEKNLPSTPVWQGVEKGLEVKFANVQCGQHVIQPYEARANIFTKVLLQDKNQCIITLDIRNQANKRIRITHVPSWLGPVKEMTLVKKNGMEIPLSILATQGEHIKPGQQTLYLAPNAQMRIVLIPAKPVIDPIFVRLRGYRHVVFLRVIAPPTLI